MTEYSKLLIAYDGSDCSDAALKDLRRAGLPATLDVVVITVAYVFLPSGKVPDEELVSPGAAAMVQPAQAHARNAFERALELAERGAARLKAEFPQWTVRAEAEAGSPAWAVINIAGKLGCDLIVVGSHGHSSAGGRLILGSVSQRVLYEAPCPVRVARCVGEQREGPVRIVVGFTISKDAEAAVNAVTARTWPRGSEARLITAASSKPVAREMASERLRSAGLNVTEFVRQGEPAYVLIHEAEEWNADLIFVGTRDLHGFQHFLHGSVSSAVAARAHCSVEVVRAKRTAALNKN